MGGAGVKTYVTIAGLTIKKNTLYATWLEDNENQDGE